MQGTQTPAAPQGRRPVAPGRRSWERLGNAHGWSWHSSEQKQTQSRPPPPPPFLLFFFTIMSEKRRLSFFFFTMI